MPRVPRWKTFTLVATLLSACVPSKPEPGQAPDSGFHAPSRHGSAPNALAAQRVIMPRLMTHLALTQRRPPRSRRPRAPSPPAREPRHEAGATAAIDAGALGNPSEDPMLKQPFVDNFNRPTLGDDWRETGSAWKIRAGQLCVKGARNHGVWLKRRLPENARIEFDAIAGSADGDIKAEFWGDGKSAATGISYTNATSYLTILGGWHNTYHVLARLNEHAPGRPEIRVHRGSEDLRAQRVVAGARYHFKVERNDGKTLAWFVNDIEILSFSDRHPLTGPGHDHFGFNNWQAPVCFDNLKITPLGGS